MCGAGRAIWEEVTRDPPPVPTLSGGSGDLLGNPEYVRPVVTPIGNLHDLVGAVPMCAAPTEDTAPLPGDHPKHLAISQLTAAALDAQRGRYSAEDFRAQLDISYEQDAADLAILVKLYTAALECRRAGVTGQAAENVVTRVWGAAC
jgi:hypothetical protein